MPKCWNGRRSGLKIRRGQPHEGSSPSFGTRKPLKNKGFQGFFIAKANSNFSNGSPLERQKSSSKFAQIKNPLEICFTSNLIFLTEFLTVF